MAASHVFVIVSNLVPAAIINELAPVSLQKRNDKKARVHFGQVTALQLQSFLQLYWVLAFDCVET